LASSEAKQALVALSAAVAAAEAAMTAKEAAMMAAALRDEATMAAAG